MRTELFLSSTWTTTERAGNVPFVIYLNHYWKDVKCSFCHLLEPLLKGREMFLLPLLENHYRGGEMCLYAMWAVSGFTQDRWGWPFCWKNTWKPLYRGGEMCLYCHVSCFRFHTGHMGVTLLSFCWKNTWKPLQRGWNVPLFNVPIVIWMHFTWITLFFYIYSTNHYRGGEMFLYSCHLLESLLRGWEFLSFQKALLRLNWMHLNHFIFYFIILLFFPFVWKQML